MEEKEVCKYHYTKLKALLDADEKHISRCLAGDFLSAYREIIHREREVLAKIISKL